MSHDNASEEGLTPSGVDPVQSPNGDFLVGAIIFAVALYTLNSSIHMPFYGDSGVWGSPGLTPGLISVVLLLLSGLLMFRSRRLTVAGFGMSFSVERARGLLVFGLIVGYVAAIPLIGYPIATFLILFIFQTVFATRHDLKFIVIWGFGLSAILTVILYYLFAEFFFIPLPKGIFGV